MSMKIFKTTNKHTDKLTDKLTNNIKKEKYINSPNSLCFTDEDKDLISNDFCLEKDKLLKKKQSKKKKVDKIDKVDKVEKFEEDGTYDLSNQQKDIIQKNSIIKERLLAIDKILELYPNLKKDKRLIVNNVLGGKQEAQKKEYIVEKINVKSNKSVYKDTFGNLIDSDVNLIGFWSEYTTPDKNTKIVFHFFDDIKKIKSKIARNKRKINLAHIANIKNNENIKNKN